MVRHMKVEEGQVNGQERPAPSWPQNEGSGTSFTFSYTKH